MFAGRAVILMMVVPFLTTSPLTAQAAMQGIVREDSSARPIEGVEVLINGTAHRTMTNAAGRYQFDSLPNGLYQVIFRVVGHLPVRMDVRLVDGETTRANATLIRSDVVLDPIEVTGEPVREAGLAGRGFEERRKMGFGRFIDEAEMRRSEHLRLDDLLRRHGVEIRPLPIGGIVSGMFALSSRKLTVEGAPYCFMSIFVDGILVVPGKPAPEIEGASREDYDLKRFLQPGALVAAEIYRRASEVPIQFGGSRADCGVIVLWSRRGP